MIAIKINKCSDNSFWYSDLVGETVPLVRILVSEGCYLSREPAGYTNIVKMSDAELVEVTD